MASSSVQRPAIAVASSTFSVVIIVAFGSQSIGATVDAAKAKAEQLVSAAVQAELNGDSPRSFALLHEALRADPENKLAHWQLGEIKINDQWVAAA